MPADVLRVPGRGARRVAREWAVVRLPGRRLGVRLRSLDFAGGGVVHLTGGVAANVNPVRRHRGTTSTPSRGDPVPMRQQSVVLQVLGTLTLWLGWFAFTARDACQPRARASRPTGCFTTTLSGATDQCQAPSTGVFFYATKRARTTPRPPASRFWRASSRSRPSATSNALGAFLTGLVAGPLYGASAHFVEYKLRIDDVCSARVHATCGMWGLIAAALFATPRYYDAHTRRVGQRCMGAFYGGKGHVGGRHSIHPAGRGLGRGPGPHALRGHEADLRRAVGLRGPHFGF